MTCAWQEAKVNADVPAFDPRGLPAAIACGRRPNDGKIILARAAMIKRKIPFVLDI
jgi:hypothetical protein